MSLCASMTIARRWIGSARCQRASSRPGRVGPDDLCLCAGGFGGCVARCAPVGTANKKLERTRSEVSRDKSSGRGFMTKTFTTKAQRHKEHHSNVDKIIGA